MGQLEFDACIAAGGSSATCAVHLEGGGDIGDLSGLVGNVFGETSSGFVGVLEAVKSGVTGRIVGYKLVNESGQSFKLNEGMQLGSATGRSFDLGNLGAAGLPGLVGITSTGTLSEAQFNRLTGTGSGPSGTTSFASTQAAQTQAEAFAREQAATLAAATAQAQEESRRFQTEQNRLAEEAALKRGRFSTLTDLIQSFVGAQSQARDTLANLQPDPFRFAAVAGGVAPFGATPQQGFQQQLQQFAGAPVPTADPNASLPSIESAIQGLTGASAPLNPQVFGAAGGATIPAPLPGQSVAVKVGEKGEEILRVTSQGVEVIPLSGGMQEGGTIGFPFQPIEFDKSSLFPALTQSGIFSGFNNIPRAAFRQDQSVQGLSNVLRQPLFERLGIRPSFVSPVGRDEVFFVNPETGQRQLVSASGVAGIQPRSIAQVENIGQFGSLAGTAIGREGLNQVLSQVPESTSAFTRFSAPIVEPTTGTLLPAPFTVAEEMNRLRLTNPTAFQLLLSAYDAAGVPAGAVLGGIQSSLSFGAERGAVGLR